MANDPSDLESFDVDEVKTLRKSTANNQPSNPYIRKGMGVLNFVNDFNPAVALAKTGDSVTSDVNRGDYKNALGTLALEAAMSNPVTKALGKAYKKIRGVPSSSYGGPLSSPVVIGIDDVENKVKHLGAKESSQGVPAADSFLSQQLGVRGYNVDPNIGYIYKGVPQKTADDVIEGGWLRNSNMSGQRNIKGETVQPGTFTAGEPLVSKDYPDTILAFPYDKRKVDMDKYLLEDRISNSELEDAFGRKQWVIDVDHLKANTDATGLPVVSFPASGHKSLAATGQLISQGKNPLEPDFKSKALKIRK